MIWIPIDRTAQSPLFLQIYSYIRAKILRGELQGGERLPSTRELASAVEVSRNVIVEAYEQLLAEGFIEGHHGSGTFVAHGTQIDVSPESNVWDDEELSISSDLDIIDFRSGVPALDLFPRKTWGRLAAAVCSSLPDSALSYDRPQGRPELRNVLCRHLRRTRGVICRPDQLVITLGTTQALTIVAKAFVPQSQEECIVEDPITREVQEIFVSHELKLSPVPVDHQGLQTNRLPDECSPAFIYVTPSHQFPMGATLPANRRIELIRYAKQKGCFIIEDDYDSEFRHEGAPISSLQGLDPGRVIYIGTFSKTLAPSLRIGFLVLPPQLIHRFRQLKWLSDLHNPSIDQLILARFIEEGHFDRHVAKMRKVYRSRRNAMVQSLKSAFNDNVRILGDTTGMHLVAKFEGLTFTDSILSTIKTYGVLVYPVETHAIKKGRHIDEVIVGYGNLRVEEIETGIRRMYEATHHYGTYWGD